MPVSGLARVPGRAERYAPPLKSLPSSDKDVPRYRAWPWGDGKDHPSGLGRIIVCEDGRQKIQPNTEEQPESEEVAA